MSAPGPKDITPTEFEQFVRELLDQEGVSLTEYRSAHLERIEAYDGSYEFDVTARFGALGVDFLVIIECKRWSAPIEREQVQALEQKRMSTHANKAILFATSGFRRGAIQFASAHRIALVQVKEGHTAYITKSRNEGEGRCGPSWLPPYAAWLVQAGEKGASHSLLGSRRGPFGFLMSNGFLLGFLRQESDSEEI